MIDEALIRKYARPVPRYTSYPTAPHFHDGVNSETYRQWLGDLPRGSSLSLYAHIPFCDTLCWFCGCQTKQVRRYDPVAAYLPSLEKEIEAVAALVGDRGRVAHIHWGGGSPTMLTPDHTRRLADKLMQSFAIADDLEFAVEIDPRGFDRARAEALAASGLTRASIGVQDFNPKVQEAINRIQSYEETASVVETLRELGVASINLDLIYGLPHQSDDDIRHTIDKVVGLRADRIAVFGYAHVPWMKTHQKMIPDDALPDVVARFHQMELAASCLVDAGYRRIGIDHFAHPDDSLAQSHEAGTLKRNFQGYTTDDAEALIGLGASSISRLPHGYLQNEKATGNYATMVEQDGLAVVRGVGLSEDDVMRAWFIERLLSDFEVSRRELEHRFGLRSMPVIDEAVAVAGEDDRLLSIEDGVFKISDRGRPFARAVAARFDAYLGAGQARHSVAV